MVNDAAHQAEYHKNLMAEMDLAPVDMCVAMFTDSQGAEALAANPVQRPRTKYISVPYHYVRQFVDDSRTAHPLTARKHCMHQKHCKHHSIQEE